MNNKNEFLRGKPADASGRRALGLLVRPLFALVVAAALQAAAQRFAYSVGYASWLVGAPSLVVTFLGRPFPVYPFWRLFAWTLANVRDDAVMGLLYPAWVLAAIASFAGIVALLLADFALVGFRKQNVFGTARWAKKRDVRRAGLLQLSGGMVIGQLASARVSYAYDSVKNNVTLHLKRASRILVQCGIYNMLLSAPTRSGKGVSNVIPTLLSYPHSVIVLDFKGENFNLTSSFRAKFSRVYRWEPTGGKGHAFNPMMEIRPGEDAFSDANLIADILTADSSPGGGDATSNHFRTGAKDFLTSLILHCLCCPDWKNKSLSGCREFLSQSDPDDPDNKKYIYDLMVYGDHGDPMVHQAVVEGATAQRNRPDDEGGSMLSTVNNALAVFADPKVRRNTSSSEFYIDEFQETDRPISLYLTIQYSDVQRIAPLIRMFVVFFSRKFTSGETQASNRKFKVPLLFILDEFDKLGRMDELEMNMGIHNGFGIHYFLIFQSLNQLNKTYGREHAFLAHCRNSIFFAPGPGEYESAEVISKVCGRESFSKTNVSYSGNRGSGYTGTSLSSQDQERNLINPDEVMKLPLDSFILLCQGIPPYIGKKNVYYDDPLFRSRLCGPAFTTREEAVRQAAKTIKKIRGRAWHRAAPETRDIEMGADEIAAMYEKLDGVYADDGDGGWDGGPAHVYETGAKGDPLNPL
jgi:type IV secretion system protein VirD4